MDIMTESIFWDQYNRFKCKCQCKCLCKGNKGSPFVFQASDFVKTSTRRVDGTRRRAGRVQMLFVPERFRLWERLSSREFFQRGNADRGWKAAPTLNISVYSIALNRECDLLNILGGITKLLRLPVNAGGLPGINSCN